jgi:hypothetical protein
MACSRVTRAVSDKFLVFCNMTLFSFTDNYQIMGHILRISYGAATSFGPRDEFSQWPPVKETVYFNKMSTFDFHLIWPVTENLLKIETNIF